MPCTSNRKYYRDILLLTIFFLKDTIFILKNNNSMIFINLKFRSHGGKYHRHNSSLLSHTVSTSIQQIDRT